MNISFDKALLWVLPYLYFVSVMYYWGFWGAFNIDAFNYYDISDLVKGIISHIGPTLYVAGGTICIVVLYDKFSSVLSQAFEKGTPLYIKVIVSGVGIAFVFTILLYLSAPDFAHSTSGVELRDPKHELLFIETAVYIIPIVLTLVICFILSKEGRGTDIVYRYGLIAFITFLPSKAFESGRKEALTIEQNKAFNYIISNKLASPTKTVYKYLGKAGEHYILVTLDNSKHIVVGMDELSPLVTYYYSIKDTASIKLFRINLKNKKPS